MLITDIQMPEMNGIELIKQVRIGKASGDRGLSTLVVTSFSNTEVPGSCHLLDINGFLVKPITRDSAAEKIRLETSEQKNIRPEEAYQQVKSDLNTLADFAKKEEKKRCYFQS